MDMSNVELYEALKGTVGDEAARMISEVVPPARELATKGDIADLRAATGQDIAALRAATGQDVADLRAEVIDRMGAMESRLMGRLWLMFVPLWVGVFGVIATLIVGG